MGQPDQRPQSDDLAALDLHDASVSQLRAVWLRLEEAIATSDVDDGFLLLLQAEEAVRNELSRRD
jgi:hypothetical protein